VVTTVNCYVCYFSYSLSLVEVCPHVHGCRTARYCLPSQSSSAKTRLLYHGNQRPLRFIPQALRCFQRQSYQNAELILVDDGEQSVANLCSGLPRVHHIRLNRPVPTGTKLNIGIERAHGDILQKLDDDDYYHPDFLKTAVSGLPTVVSEKVMVAWDCFLVLLAGDHHLRHSGHGWSWKAGGSFCFYRKLWERRLQLCNCTETIAFRPTAEVSLHSAGSCWT
jgi:glycosyltransferase involved in cell wall biosynthesis